MRRLVLSIGMVVAVAAMSAASQNAAPQDPGQVTLNRACTVCHALTEISKFKGYYTEAQWADVVRTMRGDGAQVADGEVPALVSYIFRTYGKPTFPAGDGLKVLESSCAGCHDLQTATKLKLPKKGWQELVARMEGLGTKLNRKEKKTLVDYLSKNFPASK